MISKNKCSNACPVVNAKRSTTRFKMFQYSNAYRRRHFLIFGGIFILFVILLSFNISPFHCSNVSLFQCSHVLAFTPPSAPPPGDNVAPPLNTGSDDQGKLGDLGIGVATPAAGIALDVTGIIESTGAITSGGQVTGTEFSIGSYYLRPNNAATSLYTLGSITALGTTDANYFAGNVGIGTASPASYSTMTVYAINGKEPLTLRAQAGYSLFRMEDQAGTTRAWFGNDTGSRFQVKNFLTGGDLYLTTTGTGRVIIDNGNVGIGTTNPGAKLEVNGNIMLTSGGGQTITTPGTSLTLTQTGDSYGATSLAIQSRTGSAGALFSSATLDLVDFGFKGNVGYQSNLRYEHRDAYLVSPLNNGLGEMQWLDNATGGAAATKVFAIGKNAIILYSDKVGIGTTSPGATLEVKAGADATIPAIIEGNSATQTANLLQIKKYGAATPSFVITSDGQVGIGTTGPAATALLDLTSTEKGFLAPRMTTVQRDAILSPATGLFIYNTTTNQYNVYNGTLWGAVGGGGGGIGTYVGATSSTYSGNNNNNNGYAYAHARCVAAFSGSHVCAAYEILNTIASGGTLPAQDVWIFTGPPGYTALANDCNARTLGTSAAYGAYWQKPGAGYPEGRGLLMRCDYVLRLACCM